MEPHHQAVRAHPREFLIDDGVVREVRTRAAIFRGSVGAEKSGRAHFAPALAIAHAVAIPLLDFGHDLVIDELGDLGPEHLMFLGENISAHAFLLGLRENPCTTEVAFQSLECRMTLGKAPSLRAKCNSEL